MVEIELILQIKKYLDIDISKIYTQEGDKKHYFPIFDAVKASCTKAWFIWKICLQQKLTLEKQFPEIERMLGKMFFSVM